MCLQEAASREKRRKRVTLHTSINLLSTYEAEVLPSPLGRTKGWEVMDLKILIKESHGIFLSWIGFKQAACICDEAILRQVQETREMRLKSRVHIICEVTTI